MDEKELLSKIEGRFKEAHPDKEILYAPQVGQDLKGLFSRNPLHAIPRWLGNARYEIRMAWQRVFRGWSDDRVWGLHYAHSEEMRDKVRMLAQKTHGCPDRLCLGEGYHRCGDSTIGASADAEQRKKAGPKCEWKEILTDIADGFQAEIDIGNLTYMDGTEDREMWTQRKLSLEARAARGWDLFRAYYRDLWD